LAQGGAGCGMWASGAGWPGWLAFKGQGPMLPLVLHKPDNASNKLQLTVASHPLYLPFSWPKKF